MSAVLSNGVEMPTICFGTGIVHCFDPSKKYYISQFYKAEARSAYVEDRKLRKAINVLMNNASEVVMFDTSRAYGAAEIVLGNELKKYDSQKYFIVTKLSCTGQYNGDIRGAFESSLQRMGVEYVDLYLIHWPVTGIYLNSWKEIEKLYKEGKCRAIGVSNFNIHHLEEIRKVADILPMVNEIECHPLFTQNVLREYCNLNRIQVMAYTSTARMDERLFITELVEIAEKYKKTVAQVMLKWHQQIGNVPIVNSTNPKHIIENLMINDFSLSDSEIKKILEININSRLRYDPDNCDFRQLG